jgi:hypothetical protein
MSWRPQLSLAIAALIVLCGTGAYGITWQFNDNEGHSHNWGHDPYLHYERMFAGAAEDDSCSFIDVAHVNWGYAYWAYSEPSFEDYSGHRFWAEIWFGDNYSGPNPVQVELWKGVAPSPTVLLASTVVIVDTPLGECGYRYVADFGIIPDCQLQDESILVRIQCIGNDYTTHIYWDSYDSPSALHIDDVGTAAGESHIQADSWGRVKALYQ